MSNKMDGQKEFIEFLQICDLVLKDLSESENLESLSQLLERNRIQYDNRLQDRIAGKLSGDHYADAEYYTSNTTMLAITSEGRDFIQLGGYFRHLESNLEQQKIEKELKESTIKSNITNVKYFKWNLGLAILNVILFIINLIIAYIAISKN